MNPNILNTLEAAAKFHNTSSSGPVLNLSKAIAKEVGVSQIRVLFALPGLHRVNRGAEVAFESIAHHLGLLPDFKVTVIGTGEARDGTSYEFRHAGGVPRERFRKFPTGPLLRHECMYEECAFVPGLWRAYSPKEVDVTVTCSYPYMNWLLRARRSNQDRPAHVYVTQNGDWPIRARSGEYRFFGCEGLVCTNPEYYEAHKRDWPSVLIPNGVDPNVFKPGLAERERFGISEGAPVALIVSAIIPSKRVIEGIRAAAKVPELFLLIAGEGPLQQEADAIGQELMGARYRRSTFKRDDMPSLYRSCDVLLHMSQNEPSSLAYIEALATGIPIVTHDRDVTRWTLENKAILVNTDVSEEVAEGLNAALSQDDPADIEARRDLVKRRFSWASIAAQYGEFFRDLLSRPTRK